jgi:protoheme IX farnesyltransferase
VLRAAVDSGRMALLRRLATASAIGTLALVTIGGVVRATGSGLGCPDWPRCFGRWLPPLRFQSLIEYSHRLTAVAVGVLVVATAWVAWRRARGDRGVLWPAVAAVPVVAIQAALGRVVVVGELKVIASNLAHFVTAMALVALVTATAVGTRVRAARPGEPDPAPPRFRSLLWWSLGATAALLLAGVYVRVSGASLAFLDWPLMDGRLLPDVGAAPAAASFTHRLLALVALALGGTVAMSASRLSHRGMRALAWTAFGLLLTQAVLGGVAVLTRLSPAAVAGHVTGSSLAWSALVALAVTVARRTSPRVIEEPPPARGARERVAAYLQLAKPDIIVLLLVTTLPAMVLAAGEMPRAGLVVATLLGGSLAAAGANAINCYVDRDIDEIMHRTRGRPLPTHRVEPEAALRLGIGLVVGAFGWLLVTVNPLAALLSLAAAAFYVFVYTMWLKRSTPQNIVIGGAAGAVPALVGWAAVTGNLALPAVVLFAIVFSWTPPHFWALALRHTDDYAAARVPMLPVLRGREATARQILLYSLLLVAVTLLLVPVAGMGAIYLTAALVLGGMLVTHAVRVWRDGGSRAAMSLFRFSITYLGLLFAAVAVDRLVLF